MRRKMLLIQLERLPKRYGCLDGPCAAPKSVAQADTQIRRPSIERRSTLEIIDGFFKFAQVNSCHPTIVQRSRVVGIGLKRSGALALNPCITQTRVETLGVGKFFVL